MQRWPLREVLLTYIERTREAMIVEHRHQQAMYWMRRLWSTTKENPPQVPPLLRETDPPEP